MGRSGDRQWETFAATEGKKSLFGEVFIVEQAGRYWLWNDQGELILAKLTPSGYEELSRAKLLLPLSPTRGRDVLWCHPAFAHRRAYVHNGQELNSCRRSGRICNGEEKLTASGSAD